MEQLLANHTQLKHDFCHCDSSTSIDGECQKCFKRLHGLHSEIEIDNINHEQLKQLIIEHFEPEQLKELIIGRIEPGQLKRLIQDLQMPFHKNHLI